MGKDFTGTSERIAVVIGMLIYIAAVIFLGALTDTSLFKVFVGLLPTLLYLITFFFMFSMDADTWMMWLLPLIFPLIFIILWFARVSDSMSSMDGPVITVVNVLLSYFINIFLLLILSAGSIRPGHKEHHPGHPKVPDQELIDMRHELGMVKSRLQDAENRLHDKESRLQDAESQLHHRESLLQHKESELHVASVALEDTKSKLLESQKTVLDAKHELIVSKENFNITLRSIEDKCKAINFAIGRVYSDKKGASDEVRSNLRIDSVLYNSFSELTADFKAEDAEKLYNVLKNIYKKLLYLELPEKKTVQLHAAALPVSRDKNGNDTVLDVMQKNDSDPILEYHVGAKVICEKLMGFLKKNYLVNA